MESVFEKEDVLDIILGYAVAAKKRVCIKPWAARPCHHVGNIAAHMASVASLRTVNRLWKDMIDTSSAWFIVSQSLDLDPPSKLWPGGTYREVCQLQLDDRREQRDILRRQVGRCGGCFSRSGNENDMHPSPERPLAQLPDGMASQLQKTVEAMRFFSSETAAKGFVEDWHIIALQRYRMFLHLKRSNPEMWLVPTADIEFCWLSHIFRTESYWTDMKEAGIDPSHSLHLTKGQRALFGAAVKGTAELWAATFGDQHIPYLPWQFSLDWWLTEHKAERYRQDHHINPYTDVRKYSYFPVMMANQVLHSSCFYPSKSEDWYKWLCSEDGGTSSLLLGNSSPVLSCFLQPATKSSPPKLPAISVSPDDIKNDTEWSRQLKYGMDEIKGGSHRMTSRRGGPFRFGHYVYSKHLLPSYERLLSLLYVKEKANKEGSSKVYNLGSTWVLSLLWHAHQTDPVAYKEDCLELFDCEIHHHRSPNIGPGSLWGPSGELKAEWKLAYGTTMEEDWKLRVSEDPFFHYNYHNERR